MNGKPRDYTSRPDKNQISFDKTLDDVYRNKNRLLSHFLDKYSLGNGQFHILNMIAWDEGTSQEQIASKRNIDKSAIAKSVKKLIDNGYVHKVRDEQDKRAFCLFCTEKGQQVIPEIRRVLHQVNEILTSGSTPEDLEAFLRVTDRMNHNIDGFLKP
ncbi:MarR family winged helix-turn-helix transcriptional regulator [Vibrio methylphosphonaticus]|uniref:MarR family winged helix-turn-helix transcriptional regulator n=1 Tax=Vibrio methylphosphonaticus TaxID=2946866 RepID=UPI002029C024|nr:MarR family transcriptional regulator [Vibrio methylphosphonaticus]MCL9773755.1 MarR family transcriptional regulator [Vibrio methylphosphonaticus]